MMNSTDAERRLIHVERRLKAVLDNASLAIFLMDEHQHCAFMNAAAEAMTGYTLAETLGRPLHDVIHHTHPDGSHFPIEDCPIDRAFPENFRTAGETMFVHKDGSFYPVAYIASPIRDEASRTVGTVIEVRNIAAEKRAHEELLAQKRALTQLADSMPQLVWSAKADGVVDYYNRRFVEYANIAQRPDGSWEWETLVHSEDLPRTAAAWRHAVATGEPYSCEHRIAMADGEWRWHMTRGVPMRGDDEQVTRWYGTSTDIDDLKRAERKAEQASASKSQFLAAASHDLRQPMQSMFLFASTLAQRLADDEKGKVALGLLQQSLDTMKVLLDGLFDISKLDAGKVEPTLTNFPLAECLEEVANLYAPLAAQQDLLFRVSAPEIDVCTDRVLVARILRNLVENALRYTLAGEVVVDCRVTEDSVWVSVRDTGIGIPPDHLDRIFDELHQVGNPERDRNQGLGLGLAIVRRLSDLLGLELQVRSELGNGSEFSVRLPLTRA